MEKTQNNGKKYTPKKNRVIWQIDTAWFSRLLRHLARKLIKPVP